MKQRRKVKYFFFMLEKRKVLFGKTTSRYDLVNNLNPNFLEILTLYLIPLYTNNNFCQISSAYQQHEFFYQASAELAEKFSGEKGEAPSVRVFKDGTSYKFDFNER